MSIPEYSMEKAMEQLRAHEKEVQARNLANKTTPIPSSQEEVNLEPLRNAPPLPEEKKEEEYVYDTSDSEIPVKDLEEKLADVKRMKKLISEETSKSEEEQEKDEDDSESSSTEEEAEEEDDTEPDSEEEDDSVEVIRTIMSENLGSKLDLVYYKQNGVKMVNIHLTSEADYETTLEEFKNILNTLEFHNTLDNNSEVSEESELSLLEKAKKSEFYNVQFVIGLSLAILFLSLWLSLITCGLERMNKH